MRVGDKERVEKLPTTEKQSQPNTNKQTKIQKKITVTINKRNETKIASASECK